MKSPMLPVALAFALLPLAAHADKLNVKPGLWEVTSVSDISGMPPLPKDVLDKMTPEQRAQMEAAMKQESARGPRTDTDRECITQKDIDRPFDSADDEDCEHSIVTTTRTTQEIRLSCTGKHKGSGVFRITTPTPETMTGVLDMKVGEGKDVMTIKTQLKGRWLGPDCGDEDDEEEDTADEDESAHEEDE
jgi:Protein of unknown function (DUF3617)